MWYIDSMKVLVTGGAGYIGSHVVYELLKLGHFVYVVDIFSESRNNILKHKNVEYLEVDIRNKKELVDIFLKTKPELVFHFAAKASVPDSMNNPFDYYETNILGGLNLLEAMRTSGTDKIIFSSSASIYGEPQTETITESHPKNPTNTYGYTKLVFENILKDYNRAYNINSVSFRYFCAAGCDANSGLGENHKNETHLIPSIFETILGKREKFYVFGRDFKTHDGTGIRDYIHVSDLASAHIKAIEFLYSKDDCCEFFNLGINKGFSVFEVIKACELVSGKILTFEVKEKRLGDPSCLVADARKAQNSLKWSPKFKTIEEIVGSCFYYINK